jgi:hypothetical protein
LLESGKPEKGTGVRGIRSSRQPGVASDVARRLAFITQLGICCLGSNTSKMTKIQYLPAMGFGFPVGLLRVPETVAACRMPATLGVTSSLVRMMEHKEEI